jgi:hypothetical protein
MSRVPIWKQWLIVAAVVVLGPVLAGIGVSFIGWLFFRRLWPRNPLRPASA